MEAVVNMTGSIQDDDVALAKLLQEQERALYLFGRGVQAESSGTPEEDLSDEELARRLQEEEEAYAYQVFGGDEEAAPLDSDEPVADPVLSYEDMLALGELAGKVSKGLDADALARLPRHRVGSLRCSGQALGLDRCCICQIEFEAEDEAAALPCRHCYHADCVAQWLAQSKACPVCGQEAVCE